MSELLRQIVRSVLLEANPAASRASAERSIQDVAKSMYGDIFKGGTRSRHGEIRLQPKDPKFKLSSEQIAGLLASAGHPVDTVANPGDANSKSGKFKTYITTTGYSVVFAGGGNAGQTRENTLVSELLSVIDGAKPTPHLMDLLGKLAVNPKDIVSADLASAKRVKRPLSTKPTDVGELISDVTIGLIDGSRIFVSLKVSTGGGLSLVNLGYTGAFTINTASGTIATTAHQYDKVLAAVGLNKVKIAKGIQSIVRGDPMKNVVEDAPKFDVNALRGYLSSAYGYGYWYVKESKSGWEVVDLTTLDKLIEHVGDPKVEGVVYPGISTARPGTASSRSRSIVTTSKGRRYEFVVRNTEGTGMVPTKILVDIK
jgi:hypothetical protein